MGEMDRYVKFLELMIAKVELAGRMDKEMKEAVGKHSPSRTNEVMYG
jgi:hypothetical protein